MVIEGEVTPNRHTYVELVTQPTQQLIRPPWYYRRLAPEMALADAERYGTSSNMRQIPGDAWILDPIIQNAALLQQSDNVQGVIKPSDVQMAGGMIGEELFQSLSHLPGIGAAASLAAAGGNAFMKTVEAGASWAAELLADVAAFGKPVLDTLHYSMDRVLAALVTYPPNQPWGLVIPVPEDFWGVDNLINFYFGGPTDTEPSTAHGGEFCLNLRGDGVASLYEKDGANWKKRYSFQASPPGRTSSGVMSLQIVPYGANKIAFFSRIPDTVVPAGLNVTSLDTARRGISLYRDGEVGAGHTHTKQATGAGSFRLDIRSDYRLPIGIARGLYPTSGTLVDQPFFIPYPVGESALLNLQLQAIVPTGTLLAATVYNAENKQPLAQNADGAWELIEGVQHYYLIFDFASTPREQTPVLLGWSCNVAGLIESGTETKVTVDADHEGGVTITGQGADPGTGTAQIVVEDLYGGAGVLQQRARIKARIKTRYNAADPSLYSVLHEGETVAEGVDALLRVGENNARWWQYTVPMVSEWARIADQFTINLEQFYEDENAATDPATGRLPPWKVTSIIRYLFNKGGVDDDHLDIPDLDLRLWFNAGASPEDFLLQPTTKFGPALLKYARDYLHMFPVYDPNAGTEGKWRLIHQPIPPYTPLHTFVLGPSAGGFAPHHAGTYGANTSFIETFRIRPVAPEANYIVVVGRGEVLSDNAGAQGIWKILWNQDSFNLHPDAPTANDPTHPDFLGKFTPLLYVDPSITTKEGAAYICRRLYDQVAHGQRRLHFRAPLALITDGNDSQQTHPRPLRAADAITAPIDEDGTTGTAIIASSPSIDYHSDLAQMADYEAIIALDA